MNRNQSWLAALLAFLALSIFDALIGGAISAILRIEGWTPIDQRLNDVYHVNYAIVVAAVLIWHYSYFKRLTPMLAIVILFLGYIEDTLFYFLAPFFNPAIEMLTKGEVFHMSSGELMPQQISGWIGWVGRTFLDRNIAFPLPSIFAFNAIAVVIVIFLFFLNCKTTVSVTKN